MKLFPSISKHEKRTEARLRELEARKWVSRNLVLVFYFISLILINNKTGTTTRNR